MSIPTERSPLLGRPSPPIPVAETECTEPSDSETLYRVHWLDNLRGFLTLLLITHHAVLLSVQDIYNIDTPPFKSQNLPLALFITTNKTFLHALFFFVSGCSVYLATHSPSKNIPFLYELGASFRWTFLHRPTPIPPSSYRTSSTFSFVQSRFIKVYLPALLYQYFYNATIGYLLGNGPYYPEAYSWLRLSPVPYVTALVILDVLYLVLSFLAKARFIGWLAKFGILWSVLAAGGVFAADYFVLKRFDGLMKYAVAFYFFRWVSFEIVGPDALARYTLAYLFGIWYASSRIEPAPAIVLPTSATSALSSEERDEVAPPVDERVRSGIIIGFFKKLYYTITSPVTGLAFCLVTSYLGLGLAQLYYPPIWEYIKLRRWPVYIPFPSPKSESDSSPVPLIVFLLWSTYTFYSLSLSLIRLFSSPPVSNRKYFISLSWSRHTYLRTYVHFIAVCYGLLMVDYFMPAWWYAHDLHIIPLRAVIVSFVSVVLCWNRKVFGGVFGTALVVQFLLMGYTICCQPWPW